jgi:hypothetical protein
MVANKQSASVPRVSGQKRKVYRPKNQQPGRDSGDASALVIVPVTEGILNASVLATTEDGGSAVVAELDSNKKQKTASSSIRSADQAEAARQPCHTQ